MKLLAALALLLPAVHASTTPEKFGLKIGTNPGAAVVVKSLEYPGYYLVDTSVTGGSPLRFEWGANDILHDQDNKYVIVDTFHDLRTGLEEVGDGTGFFFDEDRFYFDANNKLAKHINNGEKFYMCPLGGRSLNEPGLMKLRFTANAEPHCASIDLYKMLLHE